MLAGKENAVVKKLVLVLLSLFALKAIFIIISGTHSHVRVWEYEEIARNLLQGEGFLYHHLGGVPYKAFNNPLYSFICAGLYFFNFTQPLVLLLQVFFTFLLSLVIFAIAKGIFDERIGFWAAVAVSLHPGILYYDMYNLIPLSLDCLLIAAAAYLMLKYREDLTVKNSLKIGAVIGLGVLTRGIIGALLPFFILYIFIFLKNDGVFRKIKISCAIIFAVFLFIGPWIGRNYAIYKKFMIVSTTGETLWRGNNSFASGTSLSSDGRPIIELLPGDIRNKIYGLDELGQKEFFEKAAFAFIKKNPLKFLQLYAKKLYYFWWFSPQSGFLYPKLYLNTYKLIYGIMAALLIYGIMAAFSSKSIKKEKLAVILFVFIAISFTQSLFYSEGRHRWLIEPMLLIVAFYGFQQAVSKFKQIIRS